MPANCQSKPTVPMKSGAGDLIVVDVIHFQPTGVGVAQQQIGFPGDAAEITAAPEDSGLLLGLTERTNDLGLPVPCNIAIARKCRQHVLVAEVLRPCLVVLRRLADPTAKERQGLTEAMRVEVGQAGRREGILENLSDWADAAPVLAVEPRCLETPVRKTSWAVQLNEHIAERGDIVFRHACKLG